MSMLDFTSKKIHQQLEVSSLCQCDRATHYYQWELLKVIFFFNCNINLDGVGLFIYLLACKWIRSIIFPHFEDAESSLPKTIVVDPIFYFYFWLKRKKFGRIVECFPFEI